MYSNIIRLNSNTIDLTVSSWTLLIHNARGLRGLTVRYMIGGILLFEYQISPHEYMIHLRPSIEAHNFCVYWVKAITTGYRVRNFNENQSRIFIL